MSMVDRAKEKAGPLPVWGWALVVTGIFIGIMYYRRKKSAAADAQAQTPDNTAQDEGDQIPASTAAEMQADYTLSNQLGLVTSGVANLATNVGRNTSATVNNTVADKANTSATAKNTIAETHNTSATKIGTGAQRSNTKAVRANTHALSRKAPIHRKHSPAKDRG